MKRSFFLLVAMLMVVCVQAQNVQLHYDFGHLNKEFKGRPEIATKVEMFKPDKLGSTFFFVDMTYLDKGVESAYWEISREMKLGDSPFSIHAEYNGGVCKQGSFADAYLLGASYGFNAPDFNSGFTLTPMYKYLAHASNPHSWQLTSTWYFNFAGGLLSFNGFMDVWGDRNAKDKNIVVLLTQPQFWLNVNKIRGVPEGCKLSLGTEWKISTNFLNRNDRWYWIPTLAMKWTF